MKQERLGRTETKETAMNNGLGQARRWKDTQKGWALFAYDTPRAFAQP